MLGQSEQTLLVMSIIITNVGTPYGHNAEDIEGRRNYEVRINCKLITSFEHTRSDGLAVCLFKAAKAVAMNNPEEAAKLKRFQLSA